MSLEGKKVVFDDKIITVFIFSYSNKFSYVERILQKGINIHVEIRVQKKEKSTHTDNNGKKILLIAIKKPLVPFPLLPGKGFIYIEKENKMIKQFPGETMKWTRKKEREREKRKKEN